MIIKRDNAEKKYIKKVEKWRKIIKNKKNINVEKYFSLDLITLCITLKSSMFSSQIWSIIIEKYIKNRFNLVTPLEHNNGDCISKHGISVEIKASLQDFKDGSFHFNQIRLSDKVDYFLFIIYNCFTGRLGEAKYLLIPRIAIRQLILWYPVYSHGSIKKNGVIKEKIIDTNRSLEFSLRANPICKGKKFELYKSILKYEYTEERLRNFFDFTTREHLMNRRITRSIMPINYSIKK